MSASTRPPVRFERSYEATVQDLWDLWTTKDGFESWWGPEGFRVEVTELDLREGGRLAYEMIADAPDTIAWMKNERMPLSHGTRGVFTRVEPGRLLEILHVIDFVPGIEPYDNHMLVELFQEGSTARMVITIEAHVDDEWTARSVAGMESQLTKVPAALAARAASASPC
ncbi:MAG: SRPBCC domain-containing protein [Myxococcales bacterium]|nr:SRPBCC domain-containing protein [Myxococcales bacterium]